MKKIHYYAVGYTSYEESPYSILCSEKLYTQEEFRELCAEITADLYNRRKIIWKAEYEAMEEFHDKHSLKDDDMDLRGSFEYLIEHVIRVLIEEHGFKSLIREAQFFPFGWAQFMPKDDWNDATKNDEDLKAIRNKIKEQ